MPSIEEVAAEEELRLREESLERRRKFSIFAGTFLLFGGWFYFAKGWMNRGSFLILISYLFLLHAMGLKKYFEKWSRGNLLSAAPVAAGLLALYETTHISRFYWGKDPSFWLAVHAGAVGDPFWSPLPVLFGQALCFLFPTRTFTLLPVASALVLSLASIMALGELFWQLKSQSMINKVIASLLCMAVGFSRPWWDAGTIGSGMVASLGLVLFLTQRNLLNTEEKPWDCLWMILGLLFSVHPLWGLLGLFNHLIQVDLQAKDFKVSWSPLALGLTPYLWVYFRAGTFFPSWGGNHPFYYFVKEWRSLWDWHRGTDWDPLNAAASFGVTLGVLFLFLVILWILNLLKWKVGNPKMIRASEVWMCIFAAILSWISSSSSSAQAGPTAVWLPMGLGCLLLSFIEKGMERKQTSFLSGTRLAAASALILLLSIGLAFLPGQYFFRSQMTFAEQHALNLLRALNEKSILVFQDPFEAAACRETRLMDPLQTKAVFLDERYLDRRWYMAQCIKSHPEVIFSSIQGSPEEVVKNLAENNLPEWDIQWSRSRMPDGWKGPGTFPTVLTQEFTGTDLGTQPPGNIQFRYDLTSLPDLENRFSDPANRYIRRYSEGFNELGLAMMVLGQYSAAIRSFERSAHLNPGDPEPRKSLFGIFAQQNIMEAARLDFEKTIKEHPARIEGLMRQLEQTKNNQDEVQTVLLLDQMIKLNQELSDAQFHLAMIYEKQGNISESKSLLESSVKLNPQRLDAQLTLGHLMAKLGNRIKAEEAFRSVLGLDPQNKEAQKELWKLLNQP